MVSKTLDFRFPPLPPVMIATRPDAAELPAPDLADPTSSEPTTTGIADGLEATVRSHRFDFR